MAPTRIPCARLSQRLPGVYRAYQQIYEEGLEALCAGYDGAQCDRICAPLALTCRVSRCQIVFDEEKTP